MTEAILATVIGGVIILAIELAIKGWGRQSPAGRLWGHCVGFLRRLFRPDRRRVLSNQETPVVRLLKFLREDQDPEGLHEGEYGRTDITSRVFAFRSGGKSLEKPDKKPRLYLTGWPVFVYKKREAQLQEPVRADAQRQLEVVQRGLSRLAVDGWVGVSLDAAVTQSPLPGVGGEGTTIISFRHSIRAAQVFLALGVRKDIVRLMLGRMLDSKSGMQREDGGWAKCNIVSCENDLWGAAYAAGFLQACSEHQADLGLEKNESNRLTTSLSRTLDWLKSQWSSSGRWAYGKLASEENAIPLYHEIAGAMLLHDRDFALSVVREFEGYLDPVGNPSERILGQQAYARPAELAARLAYAFYLTRAACETAEKRWRCLCEYSLSRIDTGMNSADAAMLLDMVLEPLPATE